MNKSYIKLFDMLLLSLAVALLIMGIHQIMVLGFAKGYWAVMLALVSFFGYQLRKSNRETNAQSGEKPSKESNASKRKSKTPKSKI